MQSKVGRVSTRLKDWLAKRELVLENSPVKLLKTGATHSLVELRRAQLKDRRFVHTCAFRGRPERGVVV